MKIRIASLALISILALSMAAIQPAAAEGGNARFRFAANVWRQEGVAPRSHRAVEPVHSVRNGAVPTGKSFLGLDANMLQKPQPVPQVVPQMQVAAQPSFTQAVPQLAVPKTNFNHAFGKPQSLNQPLVAHAPAPLTAPVGQMAQPQAIRPAPAAPAKKPVVASKAPSRVTKDVSGRIASRPKKSQPASNGMLANAKGIDSYGKNFGYVPGPFLPAQSGGGSYTTTDVHGTLIHR